MQVTHTHSPCSPSFCRMCRAQWMMMGKKKNKNGETKEQKQRLALFEIILSCTSHFFLLLRETQTDTFIQALCCGDSGFKAEWVFLWALMRKYNQFAVTQELHYKHERSKEIHFVCFLAFGIIIRFLKMRKINLCIYNEVVKVKTSCAFTTLSLKSTEFLPLFFLLNALNWHLSDYQNSHILYNSNNQANRMTVRVFIVSV